MEMLVWSGLDLWLAEASQVELDGDRLHATGTQLGRDPLPYRLDYTLKTRGAYVTKSLEVLATGSGWRRRLELRHDGAGSWTCTIDQEGAVELPAPGGDMGAVESAVDCDLGRCPLTNTMPVLRHGLHRGEGAVDFLMAWVSVPDLGVHPSLQRYEHVRVEPDGTSVVRYVGAHRGFVGELTFDADGFVLNYPQLARRVETVAVSSP
jgi:hypothetical protein